MDDFEQLRRAVGRAAAKRIRQSIIEKDKVCVVCGYSLNPVMQVHHVKPLAAGGVSDEDNLVTLCRNCHGLIHFLKDYEKGWQLNSEDVEVLQFGAHLDDEQVWILIELAHGRAPDNAEREMILTRSKEKGNKLIEP